MHESLVFGVSVGLHEDEEPTEEEHRHHDIVRPIMYMLYHSNIASFLPYSVMTCVKLLLRTKTNLFFSRERILLIL